MVTPHWAAFATKVQDEKTAKSQGLAMIEFEFVSFRSAFLATNSGFFLIQVVFFSAILFLLYLSQRFWFVRAWRLINRIGHPSLRWALRGLWAAAALLLEIASSGAAAD